VDIVEMLAIRAVHTIRAIRAVRAACAKKGIPLQPLQEKAEGEGRMQRWQGVPAGFVSFVSCVSNRVYALDNVAKPPSIAFETAFSRDRLK
jgi:hypothetical protein